MAKCDEILKAMAEGEYDSLLKDLYGEENLDFQKERYTALLTNWGMIYGRTRTAAVYSMPYSVLLAGDGADVSIPTDVDFLTVVDPNTTNVSRLRGLNYLGEDLIDLFQHGPYTVERDYSAGVLRGVQQAFLHYGLRKERGIALDSLDVYIDSFTAPRMGLDEPAHMAMAMAKMINDFTFGGQLSEKQLADIVQFAMANYIHIDTYATDVYSSLRGKAVTGDFTNAEEPVITEIDVDMCGCNMYLVDVDTTDVNIPDEEVDPRLDAFMDKLGGDIENLTEKDFYTALAGMADVDREACLFLLDYYTQENFGRIYAANAVDGMGSPSVEHTVHDEKESLPGASVWRCKANSQFWMTLCCVAEEAEEAFAAAMEKVFGEGCILPVSPAKTAARKVIG